MRDPARIPRILEALRVEWEKQPDLRLGQLLLNGIGELGSHWNPELRERALFYIDDSRLVEAVQLLMVPKGPEEGK